MFEWATENLEKLLAILALLALVGERLQALVAKYKGIISRQAKAIDDPSHAKAIMRGSVEGKTATLNAILDVVSPRKVDGFVEARVSQKAKAIDTALTVIPILSRLFRKR